MDNSPISLLELTRRISHDLLVDPLTQNVWIEAELQDVAVRGGHCYMELLQKDERGQQVARMRGCWWANSFGPKVRQFRQETGQEFTSGIKVMLRVCASMHSVFGLSLMVNDINPAFTMGDLERRRREILLRLQKEGILEENRRLEWPMVSQRIAVVSAPGAAGYGDFINQLYSNPYRLRFTTRLFPAVMQGKAAPQSIIAALAEIAGEAHLWDGVAIIRGGGATSDLQAYEDYDLAAAVAQFPLPIAIGIGHERDITVLDWVANTRLKTPTAVAEWLVAKGAAVYSNLINIGNRILQYASERIAGNKEQLAQAEALLPVAATGAVERSCSRLSRAVASVGALSASRILPWQTRLDMAQSTLASASALVISRRGEALASAEKLLEVLSPAATLARGYSITRIDGRAVSSVADVPLGAQLEITLADGTFLAHTP